MIVFDLKCRNGHKFEAWFNSAANFERLRKGGHVACAVCGSSKIEKALAAPQISPSKKKGKAAVAVNASEPANPGPAELNAPGRYANDPKAAKAADLMKQLTELRTQIEKNCDYVGKEFPEEARKMHYGESPKRNIYGEASDVEARDMADEGIEFSRIPWAPRRDS
jgi:hypothetical protein